MPADLPPRTNPWLDIPAGDYEGHMAHPSVGQAQVLGRLLAADLARFRPEALAVLGCATGNGFEHVDPAVTRRVVGIDVNGRYLDVLRERHQARLPGIELIAADVLDVHLPPARFDLVHAALFFEYVDPGATLARVVPWLRPGGVLTAVLQVQGPATAAVTPTPYTILRRLSGLLRPVDPDAFRALAASHGLVAVDAERIDVRQGKAFFVGHFARA